MLTGPSLPVPQAVATLAARAGDPVSFDEPCVPSLLKALGDAGASQVVAALAAWAADAGGWKESLKADPSKARQYPFGREPDGAASGPWDSQDLADMTAKRGREPTHGNRMRRRR